MRLLLGLLCWVSFAFAGVRAAIPVISGSAELILVSDAQNCRLAARREFAFNLLIYPEVFGAESLFQRANLKKSRFDGKNPPEPGRGHSRLNIRLPRRLAAGCHWRRKAGHWRSRSI